MESQFCIKLVIENHSRRVLFAEVGKDFVDFLFSILCEKQEEILRDSVASLSLEDEEKLPVAPPGEEKYYVMDDLVVKPVSTFSFLALVKHLQLEINGQISSAVALEEKVVHFGITEANKLMKASLVSNNVLTSVFFNAN